MRRTPQDLAERVARLEDERDVERAAKRIGWLIDHGTPEELTACLADDIVIESRDSPEGTVRVRHVGPAGRQEYVGKVTSPASRPKMHVVAIQRVSVSGDTATVESYYVRLSSPGGDPQLAAYGRYDDSFARNRDGAWLLARRVAVKDVSLANYQ